MPEIFKFIIQLLIKMMNKYENMTLKIHSIDDYLLNLMNKIAKIRLICICALLTAINYVISLKVVEIHPVYHPYQSIKVKSQERLIFRHIQQDIENKTK
jgi:anthranilate/para-aminobenzoate synthase component II